MIKEAAKPLADREAQLRNALCSPTEIIRIGPLAAGLLGKSLSWPDHGALEASLRLSQAFVHHVKAGKDVRSWRLLDRTSMLTKLAEAAVVNDGSSGRNKLVIAPIADRLAHIRLFEVLQKQEGEYEVW